MRSPLTWPWQAWLVLAPVALSLAISAGLAVHTHWRARLIDEALPTRVSLETLTAIYIARSHCEDVDKAMTTILNTKRDFYENDVAPYRRSLTNCVRAAIAQEMVKDGLAKQARAHTTTPGPQPASRQSAFASAKSADELREEEAAQAMKDAQALAQQAKNTAEGLRAIKMLRDAQAAHQN